MYSSNQVLKISCDKDQLKDILTLALRMHDEDITKRNLCYQISKDGQKIAIGWYFKQLEPGWQAFPFENPSIELLTATVQQFCEKHPHKAPEIFDGGYRQGYLISAVAESLASESDDLQSPFYGIFFVQSYKLFYSK